MNEPTGLSSLVNLHLRLTTSGPCPNCHLPVRQTVDGYQVRCRRRSCTDLPIADCVFDGCFNPRGHGMLCSGHQNQHRKGRTLVPLRAKASNLALARRDDEGRKHCGSCDRWLPEDGFQRRTVLSDGLAPNCRDCYSFAALIKHHKISVTRYLEMLEAQGGVCAICKEPPPAGQRLVIDHRHSCCPVKSRSCGKCVRGLLCGTCNTAIGLFREDPEIIQRAIDYKQRWDAIRAARHG